MKLDEIAEHFEYIRRVVNGDVSVSFDRQHKRDIKALLYMIASLHERVKELEANAVRDKIRGNDCDS